MVDKKIVIKMFMNTSFHYLSSLTQQRYWSVVAWQGFFVIFKNWRNVGFFPRMRKINLVKGTIENNRKWIGKYISTFFQKTGTYKIRS